MTSIRTKLFFHISLLVISFVVISWGLSTLVLEDYYIWQKKQNLLASSRQIDTLIDSQASDIATGLEQIANRLGGGIIIFAPDNTVKYVSFGRIIREKNIELQSQQPPKQPSPAHEPPPFQTVSRETAGDNTIEIQEDIGLNLRFIVLERRLRTGDQLVIRLPLAALAESAAYTSRFMAFTGLLTIAAGCVWAFVFAKKFTVPLLNLSQVTQSIAQLDFSRQCRISGNDELASLGKNINHLSLQLSQAIAELNQKNRELLADVEKERRLDKLRRNFISNVSHELKTPVSLILGYAEGLKDNVARDEESKNYYCSVILDEAEKIDRLIKDLLNLSLIESGFYHLERTTFDVSLLLRAILEKYQAVLQEKGIAVAIEAEDGLWADADELRIEQIIVNYLNNAIDHVDEKKQIILTAAAAPEKIRIGVHNTGQPIPEDSLESLWLSFYKVDKARTRELGGYGLGLSIVRAIQELHHNAYGVLNTDDGVSFWCDLNRAAVPAITDSEDC